MSPTCGTCRRIERLQPPAAAPQRRPSRADVQQAQALARAYEVYHLPALIVPRRAPPRPSGEVTYVAFRAVVKRTLVAAAEEP